MKVGDVIRRSRMCQNKKIFLFLAYRFNTPNALIDKVITNTKNLRNNEKNFSIKIIKKSFFRLLKIQAL